MGKLNLVNNCVEDYTIILSNKSFQHYGQLSGVKSTETNGSFNLNSANELSFKVYKYKLIPDKNIPYKDIEAYQKFIWDNLIDRKLIYVKELDEYYQIKVSIDDSQNTVKSVTAKTLCEEELSQLPLYIEINTEDDRANNGATVFYDSENPSNSLLHRILKDKAPHYTIKHVDKSLCDLQRTFTLDGTTIYDFMVGECSEQFSCLFKFNTKERGIYVYDLMTVCNECGERGDFTDVCPECGGTDLKRFGKDTPIYVDKSNLTDAIHLEIDSDSIKNCFKIECGDEDMTAAVRSLNPNGTDYMFRVSDEDKADMPKELVQKLEEYDTKYQSVLPTYQELVLQIRELNDDILYYQHSMMPTVEYVDELADVLDPKEGIIYICNDIVYLYNGEKLSPSSEDAKFYTDLFPTSSMITAKSEADKLTTDNLNPLAIEELKDSTSLATINSELKNYAKVYVKSGYVKLEIEDDATFKISEETGLGIWNGRFKVTNYSDEEDVAYSEYLTLEVNDNYDEWMEQKVLKNISSNDDEDSIFDVLAIDDLDTFKEALGLYSLSRLTSFRDAIESAKIVLFEAGQGTEGAELYESIYLPYQEKIIKCQAEIDIRQAKIDELTERLNDLKQQQSDIQSSLNLQNCLGDLYPIFCSYRREDKYSNSNYISDGLDNVQILQRAQEFWELASQEIKKASEGKCTITASLYDLLLIPEFKPILEYFELGNRIHIKVDGVLYTLMLIGYSLNFADLNTIDVTFSTATKVNTEDFESQIKSVIDSSQQMATSYDSIQKQSEKVVEVDSTMKSILQNGLDSSLAQIKNNENEEVVYGKFGILLREKDDVTGGYKGRQCRLTHNSIIFTSDGWDTASLALGEHSYKYYNEKTGQFEQATDYGFSSKFVQAGYVYGSQIIGGVICSEYYNPNEGIGTYINLNDGTFKYGDSLIYDGKTLTLKGLIESSEITGSVIKSVSNLTDGSLELSNGTLKLYDQYGDIWFATGDNSFNFYLSIYDDSDNYIGYTSVAKIRMYHATYPDVTNNACNLILGSTQTSTCMKIGSSLSYDGVNNPYILINQAGEKEVVLYGTLYALDVIGSSLTITGTKSRLAETENYNDRLLYCYEMPSPMFGDVGEGQIDETGKCYIFLDDIFAETIDTDCTYQVFLQSYSKGECYVTERTSSYFIVEGTENLSFGWEVKAVQKNFDTIRLEEPQSEETTQDYAEETYNYLIESLEE